MSGKGREPGYHLGYQIRAKKSPAGAGLVGVAPYPIPFAAFDQGVDVFRCLANFFWRCVLTGIPQAAAARSRSAAAHALASLAAVTQQMDWLHEWQTLGRELIKTDGASWPRVSYIYFRHLRGLSG